MESAKKETPLSIDHADPIETVSTEMPISIDHEAVGTMNSSITQDITHMETAGEYIFDISSLPPISGLEENGMNEQVYMEDTQGNLYMIVNETKGNSEEAGDVKDQNETPETCNVREIQKRLMLLGCTRKC